MRDFRQLKVWEKAHKLTLAIYHVTATFPQQELFGLTSQLRRAAASIPANIAEGCGPTLSSQPTCVISIRQSANSSLSKSQR